MRFVFALCALVIFMGCNKKAAAPEASSGAKSAPASPEVEAEISHTKDRLTQALRKYAAENQKVPTSLDELVGAGYLTEVPIAPGGGKYVFNQDLKVTVQ
jgi:hypothetical protein